MKNLILDGLYAIEHASVVKFLENWQVEAVLSEI
jgi:hypothetical protein